MDTRTYAERWAQTWRQAWPQHDATEILARHAPDCRDWSAPFRPISLGREGLRRYLETAFGSEREVRAVWFGAPLVDGDAAAVEWWAVVVDETGPVTLAGVTLLRFAIDGLVAESRHYWHAEPGEHRSSGSSNRSDSEPSPGDA